MHSAGCELARQRGHRARKSLPADRKARAEGEGFEPSAQVTPGSRLAGGCTRPLCDPSRILAKDVAAAEGEGFEPPGREALLFSRPPH